MSTIVKSYPWVICESFKKHKQHSKITNIHDKNQNHQIHATLPYALPNITATYSAYQK